LGGAFTNTEIPAYTVWMDFGTNQGKDKHVINGLAEIFLNQTQCDFKFEFNDMGNLLALTQCRE
jgi:hypothetical protein